MDALSKLRPKVNVRAVIVCADFGAEPGTVIAPRRPLFKRQTGHEEGGDGEGLIRYVWEDPATVGFHRAGDGGEGDKPSYFWPPSQPGNILRHPPPSQPSKKWDGKAEGNEDETYPEGDDSDDERDADQDGPAAMRSWLEALGVKQEHCYSFEQAGLDRKSEFLAFTDLDLDEVYKVLTKEPFSVPPFHVQRVCRAVRKERTKAQQQHQAESMSARGGVMTAAGSAALSKRESTVEVPLTLDSGGGGFHVPRQTAEARPRERVLLCEPSRFKGSTSGAPLVATSTLYARKRAARVAAARNSTSAGVSASLPPLEAHRCVQTQSASRTSSHSHTMASQATHRHEEVATALCLADAIKFAASTATSNAAQDSCFIVLSTLASHADERPVDESVLRRVLVEREKPNEGDMVRLGHIMLAHRFALGDAEEGAGGGGMTPAHLEEHYFKGLLKALGISFDGEPQADPLDELAEFLLPFGQRNFDDKEARSSMEWLHLDLSSVTMDAKMRNDASAAVSLLPEADVARWNEVVKGLEETGTPERLTALARKLKQDAERLMRGDGEQGSSAAKLAARAAQERADVQKGSAAQDAWKLPSEVEAKAWDTSLLACDNCTGWGVELLIDFVLTRKPQGNAEGGDASGGGDDGDVLAAPNHQDTQTFRGWDGQKSLLDSSRSTCPDAKHTQAVMTWDDEAGQWKWQDSSGGLTIAQSAKLARK